ncbi:MAG: hypothetical protein VR70_12895 [Rhodospirillaceae bacterium BRH_c57]|nr:MAG: hypothetical protein VR70_12895 [Rhodospirillaceae bacterium BRH_c57]
MVDPRHQGHDDGTHPTRPSVGGPTPDPRLGNPQPIKERNRWSIGLAIGLVVIVAVGFLIWYWTTGAVNEAAVTPTAPPVAAAQAERPRAQPGDCRPFTKDVEVVGQAQTLRGTACMQPDGTWKIVSTE